MRNSGVHMTLTCRAVAPCCGSAAGFGVGSVRFSLLVSHIVALSYSVLPWTLDSLSTGILSSRVKRENLFKRSAAGSGIPFSQCHFITINWMNTCWGPPRTKVKRDAFEVLWRSIIDLMAPSSVMLESGPTSFLPNLGLESGECILQSG